MENRGASSTFRPSTPLASSRLLKGVDVSSVWDGSVDRPARVRIEFLVEGGDDERVVLVDFSGGEVVTGVRFLGGLGCGEGLEEASGECFGDASIPWGIVGKSELVTPFGENDAAKGVSGCKRRLFPIFRSVSSDSPVLLRRSVRLSSPFESSGRVLSAESIRSHSYGTVEVHPESKASCPFGYHQRSYLPFRKHSGSIDVTPVSSRRHCEACKISRATPNRRRSEGPQKYFKPLSLEPGINTARNIFKDEKERPIQVSSWPKKSSVKETRYASGFNALSSSLPITHLPGSATKKASPRGTRACRISRTNSKTFHNHWNQLSRLPSRLPTRALDYGGRFPLPHSVEPPCLDSIESQSESHSGNSSLSDSSLVSSYTNSPARTPSPNISPRLWLRRDISSSRSPPEIEKKPLKPRHYPLSRTTAKTVELHFEKGVVAGILRVQIEASVRVSGPDPNGWREFRILGLLSPQETTVSGFVSFHLASSLRKVDEQSPIMLEEPHLATSCPMQAQFDTSCLLDVETRESSNISGKFNPQNPLSLRLRLKEPVHQIAEWSGSVVLCTSATWTSERGLQIKHHASVTMDITNQDFFAERVKYCLTVKNVSFKAQHHNLESGQFSFNLEDSDYQDEQQKDHILLSITRDAEDLSYPLQIYFTTSYPGRSLITIPLPSIYPNFGAIIAERILLTEPPPPLVIQYQTRGLFTTWKCLEFFEGQDRMTQFDRVKIPRLLPQGLKDDVILEIKELDHVQFQAIEALKASLVSGESSSLVWNLGIKLDRVCSKDLECRMSFNLQVGSDKRLLTICASDWMPDLAIVDGRITSESTEEWREDEDGNLAMFNFSRMDVGQIIRVETRWKELVNHEARKSKIDYLLPKIIGRSVLGGSLKCMVDGAVCILHNGEADDDTCYYSNHPAQTKFRLPTLHPHYTLTVSVPNVRFHSPLTRTIRFTDEDDEHSSETSSESPSCMSSSEISAEMQPRFANHAAKTQTTTSEKAHSQDEGNALAGQSEKDGENRPSSSSESDFRPIVAYNSSNHGEFLSFLQRLLTGLLQRMRRPFLLTCIVQLTLATICRTWGPIGIIQLCFRNQYADCKSKSDIGTIVDGEITKTGHDVPITTMERIHANEIRDGTRAEDQSQDLGETRHEQPMDEVAKVMDWIDRALGWKGTDTS